MMNELCDEDYILLFEIMISQFAACLALASGDGYKFRSEIIS